MKRGRNIRFSLLAVNAIALTANVVTLAKAAGGFPYQEIIDRNAFALNPAPPPAPDPSTIKPPPPKILATGIANLFGTRRALLKVLEPGQPPEPGKPPAPAQEQSYILAEGERQGAVEVLAIDERAATIKVDNYGTVMVLTLKTNLPTQPAPAPGTPAPPGMPPGFAAAALGGSAGGPPVPPGSPLQSIPMRTLRLPTPATAPAVVAPPPPPAAAQNPASIEEQTIMMELLRLDPNGPPSPPTELTPPQ